MAQEQLPAGFVPDDEPEGFEPDNFEPEVIEPEVVEPTIQVKGMTPEEEESFLSTIWNKISEPLTDAPSRVADSLSDKITTPKLDESKLSAQLRGFIGGTVEGIGDIVTGLTSPVNAVPALLTGGSVGAAKAGMQGLAKVASLGARGASGLTTAHGAESMVSPESTLSERLLGATELSGGMLGMRNNLPKAATTKASIVNTPQMPDTIYVKKPNIEVLKKAKEKGYEFVKIDDKGRFEMKLNPNAVTAPILETDIGNTRATPSGGFSKITDKEKASKLAEAYNLSRGILASIDLSAPLRQGLPLIHRKEYWGALDDMFKAFGSEESFRAIQDDIANKPLFKNRPLANGKFQPSLAEEAGLELTDLTRQMSKREDSLRSTWAEYVPGVRASNRAYTAFLNKLRADTFESLVNKAKVLDPSLEANIPELRAFADFINTATGRGKLTMDIPFTRDGKGNSRQINLEKASGVLSNTFFAPRLIASRIKMLDPRMYLMGNPIVRKEAIKSLASVVGVGTTLGQLAKFAGAEVESSPNNSDFGKIKFGNVRFDPFAGFQQYAVLMAKMMTGEVESSQGGKPYSIGSDRKFGRDSRLDVVGRFAEGKLHPMLNFATGFLRGKDFTGQPFDIPEEIAQRFIPIFLQDLKEVLTESPDLLPIPENYQNFYPENAPMAIPPLFGMGIQRYERR